MFTFKEKFELESILHERLQDYTELKRIFKESNQEKKEWMIERYEDKIQMIYSIALKLEIDPEDISYGIE